MSDDSASDHSAPDKPASIAFEYEAQAQRVLFGAGSSRDRLSAELDRLGASRILLFATGQERPLAEELTSSLPVVATFFEVRPHVPIEVADKARELAGSSRADVLLSIGGGSTTGTAKAVALTTGLPILAVPTTYAGSEATPVWGLTEAGRKTTGTDVAVLPRTVLYDPELIVSLPVELSVASGLNAMAHCVDSLWAPRANPISSALAVAGIRALQQGLPDVRADGHDVRARGRTQYGAYLAAMAFGGAGSGLHHKICHVLGGAYDLPHAAMHAVLLPYVAAFNLPAAPEAGELLREALRVDDAAAGLWDLYGSLDAPSSLRELGLAEADLAAAAELVVEAAPPSNPRPVGRTEADLILRSAWAGDRDAREGTVQ